MAQLWGGRFTKETNKLVKEFNDSLPFDKNLIEEDIEGSIAHASMLGKQEIIPLADSEKIVAELKAILEEVREGSFEIKEGYEDVHSLIEATLIDRIGETGKRLHTGRSRNDQVGLGPLHGRFY